MYSVRNTKSVRPTRFNFNQSKGHRSFLNKGYTDGVPSATSTSSVNMVNISLKKLRLYLQEMKDINHIKVHLLEEEYKKKFETVLMVIRSLNNSDGKSILDDMIEEVFLDCEVMPGTVGAYFKFECYSNDHSVNKSKACSMICMTSRPKIEHDEIDDCDKPILVFTNNNERVICNFEKDEHEKITVHIVSDDFQSLSPSQLKIIKSYGVKVIDIHTYGSNGDLVEKFTNIQIFHKEKVVDNSNTSLFWLIVLLMIIILIIVVISIMRRR